MMSKCFRFLATVLLVLVFVAFSIPQSALAGSASEDNNGSVTAVALDYGGEAKEASRQIRENLEKAVLPISNSLDYLLTRTLPEADGKPRPLGITIEPRDPVNPEGPLQVVYYCFFGRDICEPFFTACASLNLDCRGD